MSEYIVRAGDTLSKIAEKLLGSPGRWRLLAEANALTDPNRIHVGQTLVVPSLDTASAPDVLNPSEPPPTGDLREVIFSVEGNKVFALLADTDERIYLGIAHKEGLYRIGRIRPEEALQRSGPELSRLQLSLSERRVLEATAENEGALDAINTWDNAFLSFGMFQWTSGQAGQPGELPALMALVKSSYPKEFDHYWGRFGMDIQGVQGATGWLTVNGLRLRTETEKQGLRDFAWALRFIRAGEDAKVQAAQLLHAVARLDQFYFRAQPRLGGLPLAQLITSEYGVALLLDNHVNRPGYLVGSVERALQQLGRSPAQLAGTGDETAFLREYLKVRKDFGGTRAMTDSDRRAQITRRYVTNGSISDRRGTFESNRSARTG